MSLVQQPLTFQLAKPSATLGVTSSSTMSAPRSFPPSSFPFFHLHPFPYSTLPPSLDQLTTQEIALSHILLNELDQGSWRKLVRIWRARREKERGSSNLDQTPSFALLDMSWPIPEDLGFLDSAQLAVRQNELLIQRGNWLILFLTSSRSAGFTAAS